MASLLGIPSEFLANALTIRQMETKHGARAGTTYALPLNRMQARGSRDALAKSMYARIFDWLIARVNQVHIHLWLARCCLFVCRILF